MGWQVVDSLSYSIYASTRLSRIVVRYDYANQVYIILYRDYGGNNTQVSNGKGCFYNLVVGANYRIRIEFTSPVRYSYTFSSYVYTDPPNYNYYHDITTNALEGSTKFNYYLEQYVSNPPSTPSSISVTPSPVAEGGTISISWGSGSGATRYYLQRSINGGSYTDIYNGTTRSYSDIALASWNTVSYRVRSYNSDGYSSYRTSSSITVTHFPEFNMRVNGALKASDNGWVKVDGVLKEIDSIWVRVNGTLKKV